MDALHGPVVYRPPFVSLTILVGGAFEVTQHRELKCVRFKNCLTVPV